MSMTVGIRLHDAAERGLEEILSAVKAQGYECGHLALSKAVPNFDEKMMNPGFALYLKKLFAKNELDVAVLGCYFNILEDFETYARHLRFAAHLRPVVVGTETWDKSKDWKYFLSKLSALVEIAEKYGVFLAIEPVWAHFINSPKKARGMIDSIQSPNLRIIYDPVNLLYADNVDKAADVLDEAHNLLGDFVDVVHIKDYVQEGAELKSVAAGFGKMNFSEVAKFIKSRPRLHVILENTLPTNAEQARKNFDEIVEKA